MGIEKSAGLVIVYKNSILLVHPTGSAWKYTYSIPKGKIEDGETTLEAAIRETKEEIGVGFSPDMVKKGEPKVVNYKNQQGKIYKKVFWFVVKIDDVDMIKYIYPVVPKELLQLDEVDFAGFVDKEEARWRIFRRFEPILDKIFLLETQGKSR
jgi:predicted NUDIX family NTP pyrophosphohydrolase